MKKFTMLVTLFALAIGVFGQTELVPISWLDWDGTDPEVEKVDEPDYANTPYVKSVAFASKREQAIDVNTVDFDALWTNTAGSAYNVTKPTDVTGGDVLGSNYGTSFKVTYTDTVLYVLLQFKDDDSQVDADSRFFEVMFNTYKDRNDTMFQTATNFYQRQVAYAAYLQWGGKALFKDGFVSEYRASPGTGTGNWADDPDKLDLLGMTTHYWNMDGNTIKAILVCDMDSIVGINPSATLGEDTISFDVKMAAKLGGDKVEYFWSSNVNQGFASLYYRGYLVLKNLESDVNLVQENSVSANLVNNEIRISGVVAKNVVVRNIVGQEVKRVNGQNVFSASDLKKGAYIVTVNGSFSAKIVK
jgi:hypothetical protein